MWRLLLLSILATSLSLDSENNIDIGQTVKEVEAILAKDPKLPRLTRGEILSLISDVRDGKDVMIVLPEVTNSSDYTTTTTTSTTTKRPFKRRRRPARPVYKHTTTEQNLVFEKVNSSQTDNPLFITPLQSGTTTPKVPPKIPTKSRIKIPNSQSSHSDKTSSLNTNSSETVQSPNLERPNVSIAAESLGPDMKQLLNSFGLLGPSTTTEQITFQGPLSPTVDPSSYSRFKPLPAPSEGMSPDMKSLLASFGLLDNRRGKSKDSNDLIGQDTNEHSIKGKKLNHIFNPATVKQNNFTDADKVSKILTKLREFTNGNISELNQDEIQALIQGDGLRFQEEIDPSLDIYQGLNEKKEKKRQEPTESSLETTVIPDTVANDTDDTGASAAELEESFGGEISTTTRRPNGFYFLLDWNSFVDVGLEERKVNINFSPKVGDPKLFLPVNIP